MKRLFFPLMCLGLTGLLTACPGPGDTRNLTVNLTGVTTAPVKVTNSSTGAVLWDGALDSGKTFSGITTGNVLTVQGGAINNYVTPAAQTVTLDADKSVTLAYTPQAGTALNPGVLSGTLSGWPYPAGNLYIDLLANHLRTTQPVALPSAGTVNVSLLSPTAAQVTTSFTNGCTPLGAFVGQNVLFDVADFTIESTAGDWLGGIAEKTADGSVVVRAYAPTGGQVSGRLSCSSTLILDLDVNLQAGWNALSTATSTSNGVTTLTLRSVASGTPTTLAFLPAPERAVIAFTDTSAASVTAGSSVSRDVTIYQNGGISGTITLETNVPGLSVSPSSVSLPSLKAAALTVPGRSGFAAKSKRSEGSIAARLVTQASQILRGQALGSQAVKTTLTFTAAADALAYKGSLQLIVKKAGVTVGQGQLSDFTLLSPSVYAMVPQNTSITLARGETQNFTFTVYSQGFFEGSTTVTLTNLPAGVTASTATVQLTPGGSAQATVQVTASNNAELGSVMAKVSGPKVKNLTGVTDSVLVTVTPARMALDLGVIRTASASGGVWMLSGSVSSGLDQPQTATLARANSTGIVQRTTVTGQNYLLGTPSGDAVVVSETNHAGVIEYTVTRYRTDGTQTAFKTTNYLDGSRFNQGVVDAYGYLWFLRDTSTSTTSAALSKVNLDTGAVSVVDSSRYYGLEAMSISPDGQTLNVLPYLGASQAILYRVTTGSGAVTPVMLKTTLDYSATHATSNSGVLYTSNFSGLTQVDLQGNVTKFPSPNSLSPTILGFDRSDANKLWVSFDASVASVNSISGQYSMVPVKGTVMGSPDINNGVWAVSSENVLVNGNYQAQYYLNFLN